MGSEDIFCLKWDKFHLNFSSSFQSLRDNEDFYDVTLISEDGNQIQAHKVILSACSEFFKNILRKNPHPNPLLYLKGISHYNLKSIIYFMYYGEANIIQENLYSFVTAAEDLQVKGLVFEKSQPETENSTQNDQTESSSSKVFKKLTPNKSSCSSKQTKTTVRNVISDDDIIITSESFMSPTKSEPQYENNENSNIVIEKIHSKSHTILQKTEKRSHNATKSSLLKSSSKKRPKIVKNGLHTQEAIGQLSESIIAFKTDDYERNLDNVNDKKNDYQDMYNFMDPLDISYKDQKKSKKQSYLTIGRSDKGLPYTIKESFSDMKKGNVYSLFCKGLEYTRTLDHANRSYWVCRKRSICNGRCILIKSLDKVILKEPHTCTLSN